MDQERVLVAQDFLRSFVHHFNNAYLVMKDYLDQQDLPTEVKLAEERLFFLLEFGRKFIPENFDSEDQVDWEIEVKGMLKVLQPRHPIVLEIPKKIQIDKPYLFRFLMFEFLSRNLSHCLGKSYLKIESMGHGVQIRFEAERFSQKSSGFEPWRRQLEASVLNHFQGNLFEITSGFPSFTMVLNLSKGITIHS